MARPPHDASIPDEPEGPPPPPARPGSEAVSGSDPVAGSDTPTDAVPVPGSGGPDRRVEAIGVLDRPIDDEDLRERLRRPGLARSTRLLSLLLGAVVLFGLGALFGRATAPDTGPGSVPDLVGVAEAVAPAEGGFPQITLRTADGGQTVLQTTAGTRVGVPRPEGTDALRAGDQVTVGGERTQLGTLIATRVDVPPAR